MTHRIFCLTASFLVLVLQACGGSAEHPALDLPVIRHTTLHSTAYSGEQLSSGAAWFVEDGNTLDVFAASTDVQAFELEYDHAARHVERIERGSYFGSSDLYLAIDSHPGTIVIGGYHLAKVQMLKPLLVARITFADGKVGASRHISALPTGENARPANFDLTDNGDGSITLSWKYNNLGDYNQDGEVGVIDITPIAQNFNARIGDADWESASLADGSGDGMVTISDISQIAQNFRTRITGYKPEHASSAAGIYGSVGSFSDVTDVPLSTGTADPRLHFSTNITSPVDGNYFRVRPYYSEDESQGAASNPIQLNLLPPGDNPVAVAVADVTIGKVSLTVNLSDGGSTDTDGTIVEWHWDLNDDMIYEVDATATSGMIQHTFTTSGTYFARMKVVDNDGRSDTNAVAIYVTNPGAGIPPTAYAFCMPSNGWAPLTVYFSPFDSSDDDMITKYEWDLDDDGSFETDATSTAGYTDHDYTTAGDHTATLRLTDDESNTSTVSVTISVRDPALSTVDYWTVFDDSTVRRVQFDIEQANWDAMWVNPDDKLEVLAQANVFGTQLTDIGLSFRGHRSLWEVPEKKPFQIDTNEYVADQDYANLKQLLFNNFFQDPSCTREKLAYDMLQFAGVMASFVCYTDIWIDVHGDGAPPMFWGVYSMVERVDKKFLANRYGEENKGGNLYKAAAWIEGGANLEYLGDQIEDYPTPHGNPCYGKRTNKSEDDYTDVINLCYMIDGVDYNTPEAFATALETVFNVDSYLRYMACVLSCSNLDIYIYTGNNYYLYNNPGTGKFEWIPWDVNDSWGLFMDQAMNQNQPLFDWGGQPLARKVIEVPRYRRAYAAYVDLLRRNYFTVADISASAQGWHDLISPKVKQDVGDKMFYGEHAMFPIMAFDTNWNTDTDGVLGVTSLTQTRCDYIDAHLLADYLLE